MVLKRPFPTLWILIFLGCLSICMQYITIDKLSALHRSELRHLTKYNRPLREGLFRWIDISLSILFLRPPRWSVEQKRQAGNHRLFAKCILQRATKPCIYSAAPWYASVLLCSGACTGRRCLPPSPSPILSPEPSRTGEFAHVDISVGNGSPYMQLRLRLLYFVGLVDFLSEYFLSKNWFMGTTHVLSGIGMYYWRQPGQSRPRGIAGLGLCAVFLATTTSTFMDVAVSLFYALLPWPFMLRIPYPINHTKCERPHRRIGTPGKFHSPGLWDLMQWYFWGATGRADRLWGHQT